MKYGKGVLCPRLSFFVFQREREKSERKIGTKGLKENVLLVFYVKENTVAQQVSTIIFMLVYVHYIRITQKYLISSHFYIMGILVFSIISIYFYLYFGKECKSSFLRLDIECGHEEKIICHILMYSGVVGSIRKGKNKILKKMCAM